MKDLRERNAAPMNKIRLDLEISTKNEDPNDPYNQDWRGLLYADDCLLNDRYSIDYVELSKSAIVGGKYFILTCGCGDTGCAGIDDPIKVTHEGGHIFWHITDPLPDRQFEFSKSDYSSSILQVLRMVQAEVPRPDDEFTFPFGYYGFRAHHLDWCVRTLETGVILGTGYEDP